MLPNRYNINNLFRAVSNPSLIQGEVNRIGTKINGGIQSRIHPRKGTPIMSEDWDNLLILDACRFDTFKKVNTIEGDLRKRRSLGSHSSEFMEYNFSSGEFHDTIYLSSNPHISEVDPNRFFHVENIFESHWNEKYETVMPEDVADVAVDLVNEYPHKRLIIHFMQPHFPYIGPGENAIPHRGYRPHESWSANEEIRDMWQNVRYNIIDVSMHEVVNLYEKNLATVLDTAEELVNTITGKSVISADHGNLFGERLWPMPVKGISHPKGIRKKELMEVPWLVCNAKERREIQSDSPLRSITPDDSVVEERLSKLGYT